jgi:integrase
MSSLVKAGIIHSRIAEFYKEETMIRLISSRQALPLQCTIPELLGHSDVSMTQRYAHLVDDSLQTATDNMVGVIDRAIGG